MSKFYHDFSFLLYLSMMKIWLLPSHKYGYYNSIVQIVPVLTNYEGIRDFHDVIQSIPCRIAEAAGTCPVCRRTMKKVRRIFTV
jgi:hypothetical protein